MLDELRRLAEAGERAGLPVEPSVVRRQARRRQVRRRMLAGVAAAAVIVGVVAGLASARSGGPSQQVKVIGPAPVASANLSSLTFVGGRVGFALDGSWLARTGDAGRTWVRIGGPHLDGLTSLRFADASVGYAWAAGELLWTGDGGITWRPVDVPNQIFDLRSANGLTQLLTGCTDGSCNESLWSLTGGTASLINHVAFAGTTGAIALNPSRGAPTYVVTSDGHTGKLFWVDSQPNNIAILSDPCPAGATFQQLARTAAASGGDTWLVCGGSTAIQQPKQVFHSSDAGQSWALMASVGYGTETGSIAPAGRVVGLVAEGEGVAWLAVDQVGVLVTADAGRTWKVAVPAAQGGPVEVTGNASGLELWAIAGRVLWYSSDGVSWMRR